MRTNLFGEGDGLGCVGHQKIHPILLFKNKKKKKKMIPFYCCFRAQWVAIKIYYVKKLNERKNIYYYVLSLKGQQFYEEPPKNPSNFMF